MIIKFKKIGNVKKKKSISKARMSLGRCKVQCNHWTQNINSAEVENARLIRKLGSVPALPFIAV